MRVGKVGDIVYVAYSPGKYGKIIRVEGRSCFVLFPRGEERVDVGRLRSLDELIEDHEKKLVTHRANRDKAREL